jgi:glucose/arabinose dehydrogenase
VSVQARTIEELPQRLPGVEIRVAFPQLRFERPLWIGEVPGHPTRLAVAEQDGRLRSFERSRDVKETRLLMDLRSSTRRRHNEEGLLGLAFHPQFETNGELYLHRSRSDPRRGVVSRVRYDRGSNSFPAAGEEVLFEVEQPFGNHNGGDLRFGPDGLLYISLGDGGGGGDPRGSGQDRSTLLGSILRIDVDRRSSSLPYSIPTDNPFVGSPGARPEIFAYGLRNVWRFSFDRQTGELWAGDVGQDRWEEIDLIERGANYGWNLREGHHRFANRSSEFELREPVVEYSRRLARSITGGFVYRGSANPGLAGAYVHGDFETGYVWALWAEGSAVTRHYTLGRGSQISSFGEDSRGELYFCSFDGQVYEFITMEAKKP